MIATLALAIGGNAAIFSVVNAVLLRELPFKNPDEVVWVWSKRTDRDKAPFTLPDFTDYRDQNQTLEQIAAFCSVDLNLRGNEKPERLQGMRVSANLFDLLGVEPVAGRLLQAEDDDPARKLLVRLGGFTTLQPATVDKFFDCGVTAGCHWRVRPD